MNKTPGDATEEITSTVTIRRAPKLSVFLVVGGLVGLVVTLVLVSLYPVDPAIGSAATFGFFLLFGIPLGVLIGAIVAIILDRRASRRSVAVVAGKLTVRADGEEQVTHHDEHDNTQHDDGTQG